MTELNFQAEVMQSLYFAVD